MAILDSTGTENQVYVSGDSGATWHGPALVEESPPNPRFEPWITFGASDNLAIVWRTHRPWRVRRLGSPGTTHSSQQRCRAISEGICGRRRHSSALCRDAMDPEARFDREAPVQLLFLRSEEPCRVGHGNDLWLIDFVCLPIGHHGGRSASEDVLHPIGPFAIWEGDQKAIVVLNRHDRSLVAPTGTASNVTDDRGAGVFHPS